MSYNKKKLINDPVYGFISIPFDELFDLIEHPYFQRLRRIQQLGLTSYVYPGAVHSRFHHALGAMHLMQLALQVLIAKGHEISQDEIRAAMQAILLHDIGHGPFSHTLEHSIIDGIGHEELTVAFMEKLKQQHPTLQLAIDIFTDQHPKHFLHQLVSSQLDVDRLDYLSRDSFFTGVSEGVVGYNRILKMFNVKENELLIEEKGIYSIEKFLVSRRLMYWQVYLHKTVLAAEQVLIKILKRANELSSQGVNLYATPALEFFLQNKFNKEDVKDHPTLLDQFAQLDDHDIMASIKVWVNHEDKILSYLSKSLIHRKLFKVKIQNKPFHEEDYEELVNKTKQHFGVTDKKLEYLIFKGSTMNRAYSQSEDQIKMLMKSGEVMKLSYAVDELNISVLSEPQVKYYLCFPNEIVDNK